MPSTNTVTIWINYISAFLVAVFAGLQGFDWLTFVDAATALKIVGGVNFLNIMVKGWLTTAQMMAQQMNKTGQS